jgi:hypothetical protein
LYISKLGQSSSRFKLSLRWVIVLIHQSVKVTQVHAHTLRGVSANR